MGKNKYTTRYFEKYALLSLKHCSELSPSDFVLSESPDLQSKPLDIGIEVTRAIWAEDVRASLIEEYFDRVLNGDNSKIWSLYPRLRDLVVIDSVAVHRLERSSKRPDFKIHIQPISQSIITKTVKLNKNYRIFSDNALYIFSFNDNISKDSVLKEIELADENTSRLKHKYQYIYINTIDEILVYDRKTKSISSYPLSSEILSEIQLNAENI